MYTIISSSTPFGIDDPWLQLSSIGGLQEVTSLSRCNLAWIDYNGDTIKQLN